MLPTGAPQEIAFALPRTNGLRALRIDPGNYAAEVRIAYIDVHGPFRSTRFDARIIEHLFRPEHDIGQCTLDSTHNELVLHCTGPDPQLISNTDLRPLTRNIWSDDVPLLRPLLLCVLVGLLVWWCARGITSAMSAPKADRASSEGMSARPTRKAMLITGLLSIALGWAVLRTVTTLFTGERAFVLELSGTGYGIYDEVVPLALAREQALLAHFAEGEKAQLEALLEKLARGLRELDGGG